MNVQTIILIGITCLTIVCVYAFIALKLASFLGKRFARNQAAIRTEQHSRAHQDQRQTYASADVCGAVEGSWINHHKGGF